MGGAHSGGSVQPPGILVLVSLCVGLIRQWAAVIVGDAEIKVVEHSNRDVRMENVQRGGLEVLTRDTGIDPDAIHPRDRTILQFQLRDGEAGIGMNVQVRHENSGSSPMIHRVLGTGNDPVQRS